MKEELLGDSSVIKMQKAGGADEIVEAYITRWQELEIQDRVQQRQELEVQEFTVFDCYKTADSEEGDHNFCHGARTKSRQTDSHI